MDNLERLQNLQKQTLEMMKEIKLMSPDNQQEDSECATILLNLATISKNLNVLSIKAITE
jgi:hypothetical protein